MTEVPADERRVDACWWKVLRSHRMLTEVDERSGRCAKSLMKVLLTLGKLTKGPADTRNVDGWSLRYMES